MQKNITIKDIARKFKCSPSTVSRALNDHPLINQETKNTIKEYAERMGYQKNEVSLSLLNKTTKTIGIVVPSILHSHETLIIEGIKSKLHQLGFMLMICVTEENTDTEVKFLSSLGANRVAAVFISVARETQKSGNYAHLEYLQKKGVPVILIDREIGSSDFHSVTVDDYLGAYMATQHLIDVGCRQIAHLAGPQHLEQSQARKKGYMDALTANKLPVDHTYIIDCSFNIESALEPTKALLKLPKRPDGIFSVNDYTSYGAIQVLKELGVSVPEDICVAGFDNIPLSTYFDPALTTIDRQSFEIGVKASKYLLKLLADEELDVPHYIFKPELIIRNSTKVLQEAP